MAQMSDQEKEALLKICSVSLKDGATIKDIFFSILSCISLDSYESNESEMIIPYIAKLKFKYEERPTEQGFESKVLIEAEPLPSLITEFIAIRNDEEPPSKKYFRKQNSLQIEKFLKMDM
jgi:hypothetical protein